MKKPGYTDMNRELIEACKNGNRKAQFEVYEKYYRAMYNTSLRIVGDQAEAEDIMQEGFLSAFRNLSTYRGEVSFGAWLKKIIVNKSLDAVKLKKAVISIETAGVDIPGEDEHEMINLPEHADIEQVKKCIDQLPEGYRIVLSLYLLEGFDHEEISQILGISNATSRTQYHRAKKKLAELLNEKRAVS